MQAGQTQLKPYYPVQFKQQPTAAALSSAITNTPEPELKTKNSPLLPGGIFHAGLLFGASDDPQKPAEKPVKRPSRLIVSNRPVGTKKSSSAVEFEAVIEKLEKAADKIGLDYYPINFYQMGLDKYFQVLARDGFPNRYSHWSTGQRYHELVVPHLQGYSQLREMVTHLKPHNKAYILETVPMHGKKTWIGTAIARSHLHKNNKHFKHTDGNFDNQLSLHSSNIEEFYERYGRDEVEQFIDQVLMIKELIDDDTSKPKPSIYQAIQVTEDKPAKDIMAFIAQHAKNLTPWKREVISMIRDESYYLLPHRKTKVLGDGFAAFINRRINVRNPDLADNKNLINEVRWITRNMFRIREQSVNTYMLGEVILKGIETKAAKKHGADSPKVMEEVLKVVADSDDYTLIDKHLTKEMVEELLLYTIAPEQANAQETGAKLKIQSKEFDEIKESLLQQFKDHDGGAIPSVVVADDAFKVINTDGKVKKDANDKEMTALLLRHEYEYDLRKDWAEEVLKNLELMWSKPVYIETAIKDKDGKLHPVFIRSMMQQITYVNEEGKRINKNTGKLESETPISGFGGGWWGF